MWNLKIKWLNITKQNRLTDMEDKPVVTSEEREGGGAKVEMEVGN